MSVVDDAELAAEVLNESAGKNTRVGALLLTCASELRSAKWRATRAEIRWSALRIYLESLPPSVGEPILVKIRDEDFD